MSDIANLARSHHNSIAASRTTGASTNCFTPCKGRAQKRKAQQGDNDETNNSGSDKTFRGPSQSGKRRGRDRGRGRTCHVESFWQEQSGGRSKNSWQVPPVSTKVKNIVDGSVGVIVVSFNMMHAAPVYDCLRIVNLQKLSKMFVVRPYAESGQATQYVALACSIFCSLDTIANMKHSHSSDLQTVMCQLSNNSKFVLF